jgi:tetrahydromethanopterin S-methyltransferase subunit F
MKSVTSNTLYFTTNLIVGIGGFICGVIFGILIYSIILLRGV